MAQTTSETWDSRWASTRRTVRPEVIDNFFEEHPTLDKFRKGGMQMTDTGGKEIQVNLQSSGGTAESFDRFDQLNKRAIDPFESAFYKRRYYAVPIVISQTDEWENAGPAQVFNLLKGLGDNAAATLMDAINADILSAQSGKNMLGLQDLIKTDGTGTIGGINASNETWWANQYDSNATTFLTQTTTNIFDGIEKWNDVMDACEGQGGRIKLMVTTRSISRAYRVALTSQGYGEVRVSDARGIGGPRLPTFNGAELIADNDCPANYTYFINTDAIKLNVLKQANFIKTPFTSAQSGGQLAQIAYMVAGVQLTTNNRRRSGVASAITGA